jgi:DNA-binding HxlR family transcriptional regulator
VDDRTYHCAVEVATSVIGGKWTPVVLAHIKEGATRFSELRRRMPDVTDKMLAQRLRELERAGVLERHVVSDTPPHVEYAFTDAGRTLIPVLRAMHRWGDGWAVRNDLAITDPLSA